MEVDLVMLNRRIARLEALVGTPPPGTTNLQRDLQSLSTPLRKQIPDEMVAAFHALALLSRLATPSAQSGAPYVRDACATAEALLADLSLLQPYLPDALPVDDVHVAAGTAAPASVITKANVGSASVLPPVFGARERKLHSALARRVHALALSVDAEEVSTDSVLAEFDSATARLNAAILALAQRASVQPVQRRPNGDDAVVEEETKDVKA